MNKSLSALAVTLLAMPAFGSVSLESVLGQQSTLHIMPVQIANLAVSAGSEAAICASLGYTRVVSYSVKPIILPQGARVVRMYQQANETAVRTLVHEAANETKVLEQVMCAK
jgi:ABC-type glucose/galactose transport system permease subunit